MLILLSRGGVEGAEVRVEDFGAKGDGCADDGPAIERALATIRRLPPPVVVRFEKGRKYRIASAPSTWVFHLDGLRDLTLDGNGSSCVLDARLRFLHLTRCSNVIVRGFSLDFDPLPFADGIVVAKNPAERTIDVRVDNGFALPPLGGPTGEREQAYFAMLWRAGPHSLLGEHYFVQDAREAYPGSLQDRVLRVAAAPGFQGFDRVRENETRVSLPVRGIAHKVEGHGASPAIVVEENENVRFEDMNLWSAPLFAVNVARNRGECVFRRFDIRPKPGTGRLTSSWRDGFHVKGNYARLLWEDCRLEGMNDDAFNIATHSSQVVAVLSPTSIRIRQNFPLGFVPYQPGDLLAAFDVSHGRILGRSKVVHSAVEGPCDALHPDRPAPQLLLTLETPLEGIDKGDVAWNESSANPDTTLRRCTIFNSCRFQSPVTVDACDITAFCWFYGDNLEGPLPPNVVVKNSRLRPGRGNPEMVASFTSLLHGPDGQRIVPREPVITHVLLAGNTVEGLLDIGFAEDVALRANRFLPPGGRLALQGCRSVLLDGNMIGESPLDHAEQVIVRDHGTKDALTVRGGGPSGRSPDSGSAKP